MNQILLFEDDFISPTKVKLTNRRLKHILEIHRAEKGNSLKVGLLNNKQGTALITDLSDEYIEMEVSLSDNPPPPLDLTLIIAMHRPKVLKRVLQYATAMGIKRIYIINTWRVEKSFWQSPVLNGDKLNEMLFLGLEQAKDTILPEIFIKKRFKPFVEDELPEIIKGTIALTAHPSGVETCPRNVSGRITLAIGPEGGFIPYEVDLLSEVGFKPVSIGDRILRVENALSVLVGRLF